MLFQFHQAQFFLRFASFNPGQQKLVSKKLLKFKRNWSSCPRITSKKLSQVRWFSARSVEFISSFVDPFVWYCNKTKPKQSWNSSGCFSGARLQFFEIFLKYFKQKNLAIWFKARDEREQKEERRNSSYFNQTGKEKSLQLTTVISTGSYDDYLCRVTWNLTPFPAF